MKFMLLGPPTVQIRNKMTTSGFTSGSENFDKNLSSEISNESFHRAKDECHILGRSKTSCIKVKNIAMKK